LTRVNAAQSPASQSVTLNNNTWTDGIAAGSSAMTRHILPEDEIEDRRTLRRLGLVIGGFFVGTAAMALIVGMILG
jgi:hypothetical protein